MLGSGSKKFCKQNIFASKSAVKTLSIHIFLVAIMKSLFSFPWKIPALLAYCNLVPIAAIPILLITHEACDSNYADFVVCKQNIEGCPNLVLEEMDNYSQVMSYDVCCFEPVVLSCALFVLEESNNKHGKHKG